MIFKGFIRNKQETIGILGLLLVVLSLTGLLGCPSPTPPVKSATAMEGTFTYADLTTAVGNQKEGSPEWSGNADKQLDSGNIEYTITSSSGKAGTGVTINPDDGKITVGTTATAEASSGEYTVTATGKGAFKGTIDSTITITINASATSITGTLSYDAIETAVGTAKNQTPSWSGHNTAQTVTYSITPAKNGISIDQATGEITVASTAPLSTGTYTVTADGAGNYEGTKTATLTITIAKISITGTLSYDAIETAVGTDKNQTPSWSGHNTAQTVTYSIAPATNGISIDQATGEVTVAGTAPTTSSGTYTVTVTGTGDYGGDDIIGTITVAIQDAGATSITGTLSYGANIDTTFGTARTQTPSWSGHNTAQTVTYSIAPAKQGISIDQATGEVTVAGTAPTTSSGAYTVTATGYGDYKDSITADITITIAKKAITGTLSYGANIDTTFGTTKTQTASWSSDHNTAQTVTYSIAPTMNGISIDQATGEVTVSNIAPVSTGTYTVTADGTGNYEGTKTATLTITIGKAPITATLSYDANIDTTFGTAKTQTPSWSPDDTARTVTYVIAPAKDGISIDQATGEITVSNTAPVSTGTYTVTATGTGYFQGTRTATILITITATGRTPIRGEFSYENVTVAIGEDATATPEWVGHDPTQLTNGYTYYSVTPTPSGDITFENPSGVFNVKNPTTVGSETYTVTAMGLKDYSGTKTATITITIAKESKKSLTGSFYYPHPEGITVAAGNPGLSYDPNWEWGKDEEKDPDQITLGNIEYSIAPPSGNDGTGVTIAKNGAVYFDSTITVASAGVYTVTATGIGAFTGKRTAPITIKVSASAIPLTGSLKYDVITTVAGSPKVSFQPKWTGVTNESEQNLSTIFAEYSITPPPGKAGKGVQIIQYLGDISVDSTATVESSGVYTVTATGVNKFGGTITADVEITVHAEGIPIVGELKYEGITAVAGGMPKSEAPTWTGVTNDDQKNSGSIEYDIIPPLVEPGDRVVLLDHNTGRVVIQAHAAPVESVGEYVYTVTATGTGAFTGKRTATIKITLTEPKPLAGSFSYGEEGVITVTTDTKTSFPPNWIGHDTDQLESLNIDYKIEPSSRFFSYGTGILEPEGIIRVEDSGTYTVTATGTGDFQGTKTATVTITVTEP